MMVGKAWDLVNEIQGNLILLFIIDILEVTMVK